MSRRPAPRPAAGALRTALERAAPKTRLAATQAVWAQVVGERIAAVARPVSERQGTVTVECADTIWVEELDLMRDQLERALSERLGETGSPTLRFRACGTR